MNILCGTTPLSVPILNKQKLAGKLNIKAPFIITGGLEIMSDLQIGGVVNIPAVQNRNGLVNLTAVHSEIFGQSVNISNSLSGMEKPIESLSINTANSVNGSLSSYGELSEFIKGLFEVSTTTGDCSKNGQIKLINPLGQSGEKGSLKINLPQTTGEVISDTLSVTANGYDVTKYLQYAEVKLFGENEPLTLSANFSPLAKTPENIQLNINNESYHFEVDTFNHSNESLQLTAVYSDTPQNFIVVKNRKASEICADNSSAIFSANDFLVGSIEEEANCFELVKILSELSGTSARQMPDGRSMIFENLKNNPVYKPENILSWEKTSKTPISSVEVIYGKSGDNYITLEIENKTVSSSTTLRIYSEDQPSVKTDSGTITLISRGNCETITEEVTLTDGVGRLSKPALFVISDEMKSDGKTIYSGTECKTVSVTYETVYDEYKLSPDREQNLTVCAYLENRAVIITGEKGEDITIELPNICDSVTAHRVAKSVIRLKSERSIIRTTHSNLINSTSGLNVKTPYCEGFLDSAKIIIKTNPMKIIDELEVV